MDFYGVYRITPKGELQVIAKPQGRPNGIALSPDGRILYVANRMNATCVPTMWTATANHPTNESSYRASMAFPMG